MATYYVDSAAAGANDGTSWTDAWTAISSSAGSGSGDIVYVRGTQTLSTPLTPSGTTSSNTPTRWIGCNASGVADGTLAVLDGNSTASSCLSLASASASHTWWQNFECKNATGVGVTANVNGFGLVLQNIYANNNGGDGFSGMVQSYFSLCRSSTNTSDGYANMGSNCHFHFCVADNNTALGWTGGGGFRTMVSCLSYGNGNDGIGYTSDSTLYQCTSSGNSSDAFTNSGSKVMLYGCRATGSGAYGLNTSATRWNMLNACYMPNTGEDLVNASGKNNNTIYETESITALDNQLSGTDTDGGYTSSAGDNYNLDSAAFGYSVQIDLDGTNNQYLTTGLNPDASGNGGGGSLIDGSLVG